MLNAETRKKFKGQTMGYMAGAFGLIAGLAWNDAIKSLIEFFFPFSNSTVLAKFIYAILVTVLVFFLGQYIFNLEEKQ